MQIYIDFNIHSIVFESLEVTLENAFFLPVNNKYFPSSQEH